MTSLDEQGEGAIVELSISSLPEVVHGRLDQIRWLLSHEGLGAGVIAQPANYRYLTASGTNGGNALLIFPDRLLETKATSKNVWEGLARVGSSGLSVGSDSPRHSLLGRPSADLSAALAGLRRQKDATELAAITRAARIVDRGLEAAREVLSPGVDDFSLLAAARAAMVADAEEPIDCGYNIGVGAAGADPDARCSGSKAEEGALVFVDLYPRVGAYFADATRTFCSGRPHPEAAAAVDALWAALTEAARLLRPGVEAAAVDRCCRAVLSERGLAADYPHHTGHGVGLEQQEPPWVVPGSTDVLVAGDVVALEPGIYGDSFGMRVEELFLVTDDGEPDLLSYATRALEVTGSRDA
ncbi:MAG: peptidase family protein [Acidimicrobiaceae bacterium]|nr:peptidase family protein [Acidimicrobiaceae bacterium]